MSTSSHKLPRLIAVDVDGTLLDKKHTIHPITKQAIHKIRKSHPQIPIIMATGIVRNAYSLSVQMYIMFIGPDREAVCNHNRYEKGAQYRGIPLDTFPWRTHLISR